MPAHGLWDRAPGRPVHRQPPAIALCGKLARKPQRQRRVGASQPPEPVAEGPEVELPVELGARQRQRPIEKALGVGLEPGDAELAGHAVGPAAVDPVQHRAPIRDHGAERARHGDLVEGQRGGGGIVGEIRPPELEWDRAGAGVGLQHALADLQRGVQRAKLAVLGGGAAQRPRDRRPQRLEPGQRRALARDILRVEPREVEPEAARGFTDDALGVDRQRRRHVAAAEKGEQLGLRDLVDVLDARADLYDLRIQFVEVVRQYLLDRLNLQAAVGDLGTQDLVDTMALLSRVTG